MSYPKPLSGKSLERLYAAAGLSEKQIDFVHSFFSACANLYGVLMAEEAWSVYKELASKTETVRLRRKDMYAALGALRREAVPFYVFEADEVFSEEPRADKYRVIALRKLVRPGYGKYTYLYQVMDTSEGKPFYVPENLLEYVDVPETKQERKLLGLLEGLKSTLSEYEDQRGRRRSCAYTGKYLRDFSYIGDSEQFELSRLRGEIDGYKGNAKRAAEYEARLNSVTAAQYLVNEFKWYNHIGNFPVTMLFQYFFYDLNAMGVNLSSEKEADALLCAVIDMSNHQHLWCNHGWTPWALAEQVEGDARPIISLGPGLQEAFAEDRIDREELVNMLEELGIEVSE